MAQNMVTAAESLGMGSCFIGAAPYMSEKLREKCCLPDHVFPLVILAMGFPAEDPPVRPRYPMEFHLYEERYPEMTDEMVKSAMEEMDRGYLEQDYYRNAGFMIPWRTSPGPRSIPSTTMAGPSTYPGRWGSGAPILRSFSGS